MVKREVGGKEHHGVLFMWERGSCSQKVHWVCSTHLPTLANLKVVVMAIYMKTGGKNSKYSWTQAITNISGAATIHVQLFRHIFRNCYSKTHNQPIPGMRRFEIIAPWQFLCAASAPAVSDSGEMVLTHHDYTIAEVLERSAPSISVCMHEFIEKRGQKALEEEEDGGDGEIDE